MNKIFIAIFAVLFCGISYADNYITQNVVSGCNANNLMAVNNKTLIKAIFEPIEYTCASGYFLPANGINCVVCPSGFTCPGGTFAFNENHAGGISAPNNINQNVANVCSSNLLLSVNNGSKMKAVFEPISITCNSGYYLDADAITCSPCLKDNYCGGGTYTFNETTQQGITPCSGTTPYAPAGSPVCYPKMMHLSNERPEDVIYLKTTETTTPAFHVNINGTTYHANLTTTPTYMTAASEHYLKIMVDNTEYYVCDDTTYVAE